MRLFEEDLHRPYGSPASHNPFLMDSIEAGRPLTIDDGTPQLRVQLRHPAICIYDRWVAGVLKNRNLPL
jgi:hypothetical protein